MKPPILLRLFYNGKLEGVKQFADRQVVIGRNPEAQINLEDQEVSPLHALIEERDDGYFISDLGSQTGTLLNGQKVIDERIESGDELRIGSYRIEFFLGVPKPSAPPKRPTPLMVAETPPPVVTVRPVDVDHKEDSAPYPVVSVPVEKPAEPKPVAVVSPEPLSPQADSKTGKSKESRKTFAPASSFERPNQILRPGKGSVVEVSVCWKERVLSSKHFSSHQKVFIGSRPDSDVVVPILSPQSHYHLLTVAHGVKVHISPEMTGEVEDSQQLVSLAELKKSSRLRSATGGTYDFELQQGEMIRLGLQGDLISLVVRYVPETPKPLAAPLLDLTASEVTGIALASVVSIIFGIYMMLYSPTRLSDEEMLEEPVRMAKIVFEASKRRKRVQVVEVPPEKPPEPQKVQVVEKAKKTQTPSPAKTGSPGAASEVAPKVTKDKKKVATSARPGGAIKTSDKEGAQARSVKADPTKVGLLGVFGSKGTQSKLDKAYSGSGELIGMADTATGAAGFAEDREGEGFGTKLKDAGAGGKGSATVGIAGVGTKGKGTGSYGIGSGGIATKSSIEVNVGGQEAEFVGTIDREAIRRVVRSNKRVIQFCYERALQRDRDLHGKIVLEWDIGERGRVLAAKVKSSTLSDQEVGQCILARLKTWIFPEPPADQIAVVAYPFVFSSQ